MKKITASLAVLSMVSMPTLAGDFITNTNYNATFLRLLATGASKEASSTFSNPAGLAFLDKEGFHLYLSSQSAFQTRNIESTTPLWSADKTTETMRYFKGKASAPVIPTVMLAYKADKWAFSGGFAITGGGGKASFDSGLPQFNALITGLAYQANPLLSPATYDINTAMKGRQFIFGGQLGASYRVTDWLSVFGGFRVNYFMGGYEGFLRATTNATMQAATGMPPTTFADIALDVNQTGWGVMPIIGVHAELGKWSIGMKYEFKTNLNIENDTKELYAKVLNMQTGAMVDRSNVYLSAYQHGVNTPSDIAAMFSAAVQYRFTPTVRATAEFHFFDDRHAGMSSTTLASGEVVGREKTLKHGTREILLGAEWDIHPMVTISAGYQNTNYGLSDDTQLDTSFYCDSYSAGFGARLHLSKRLDLDVAYFYTDYKDYTKNYTAYKGVTGFAGKDVYSRTNKVFGVAATYKF